MTCCTGSVYGPSPSPPTSAMCGPPAAPWASTPPPTTAGSTSWTATAPRSCGPGSEGCAHGQCHQPLGGATRGRLRPRTSRVRAGPDRRRVGQAHLGRDQPVDQWGVAGAAPPRAEHPRQALWVGGRLRGSARAAAARSTARAAPGRRPSGPAGAAGLLLHRAAERHQGTVWQYTAIDVASAYAWATLQVTRRNPSATWTSQLARTVAADLAQRGWKLERVMSDNASEFRSAVFARPWPSLERGIPSSAPADRRRMAVWNACSRRSWTSAGSQPSPAP